MPQVCFYLHLHQPYRLRDFSVFEIGHDRTYFSDNESDGNGTIFHKVARKSYHPTLTLLLELLQRHNGFCFALSCSGVFLEQAEQYEPEVISLMKRLVKTGRVEIIAETYYHSLASLFDPVEFRSQVELHAKKVYELFRVRPSVFRNTELVYSNDVGKQVAELGFLGMLTEAVPRYLHGREKTQLFVNTTHELPLLLKHAQLSDDIAFRFSDKNWPEYPLSVEKYLDWVEIYPEDSIVNLFMDFETFGEHQWVETGIFEFFAAFVDHFLRRKWNTFKTPAELLTRPHHQAQSRGKFRSLKDLPVYDVPVPISWADVDRDLTAWLENDLQQDTIRQLYALRPSVEKQHNLELQDVWRRLQISDHFYYMCTKWSADGDVHAYFSPYKSPYEAYRRYSIVLADLKEKISAKEIH